VLAHAASTNSPSSIEEDTASAAIAAQLTQSPDAAEVQLL